MFSIYDKDTFQVIETGKNSQTRKEAVEDLASYLEGGMDFEMSAEEFLALSDNEKDDMINQFNFVIFEHTKPVDEMDFDEINAILEKY